mmetsp:Transcript_38868/g.88306  ORF Transcript_38868/g.88306 Transcript_38868/m.88306 type:complete len:201 (-) Transcript_38868:678-1280(-)
MAHWALSQTSTPVPQRCFRFLTFDELRVQCEGGRELGKPPKRASSLSLHPRGPAKFDSFRQSHQILPCGCLIQLPRSPKPLLPKLLQLVLALRFLLGSLSLGGRRPLQQLRCFRISILDLIILVVVLLWWGERYLLLVFVMLGHHEQLLVVRCRCRRHLFLLMLLSFPSRRLPLRLLSRLLRQQLLLALHVMYKALTERR